MSKLSEVRKKAWRKRKREGGKGKCYHCEKTVYTGGIRREGRLFHKVCYYSWKARRK